MHSKKSIVRITCLVLCLILVSPFSAFAQQASADYSNHWAGKQIGNFLAKGFLNTYNDGSFRPNEPITRADFAAIANKVFNLTEKDKTGFKDVKPSDPYYTDMLIAKKAGYLTGMNNGTILPKGYMSRQEYAVIISRLLKLDRVKYVNAASGFADAAAIPDWSKGSIGAVAYLGYMQGESGNKFNPKGYVTRGQAVAVLERCYLDNVKVAYDKPGTYSSNVIEGNAAINVPDVILENTTITGSLIIGKGVGDGNVRLKNVIVKGDTFVKGGGLNSIIIEDSQVKNIIIIKEDNKVRVVTVGNTTVESVDMQSGGKLEEQSGTGKGFGLITIAESVDPSEPVILQGNFESVLVQADGVKLDVASGSVARLNVSEAAVNTQINLGTGVKVEELVVDAKTEVTGTGTVGTAEVNTQGAVISVPTATTKAAEGVTVAAALPATAPAPAPTPVPASVPQPTPAPSPASSGGSSSSGSGSDDDEEPVLGLAHISDIDNAILAIGQSTTRKIYKSPRDAVVTVHSSNTTVAGVNVTGDTLNIAAGSMAGIATISVTASKAGYRSDTTSFTVTVNEEAIAVSVTVLNPHANGCTLALSPAVAGLYKTNFTLKDGETSILVSGSSSIDRGAAYKITTAALTAGKTYTIQVTKEGYDFGAAASFVPPLTPTLRLKYNYGRDKVRLIFDDYLVGDLAGLQTAFTVTDSGIEPKSYEVLATSKYGDKGIELEVSDLYDAEGKINVSYDSSAGDIMGQRGYEVPDITTSFNLDKAPVVINAWNSGYRLIVLDFDEDLINEDLTGLEETFYVSDDTDMVEIASAMRNASDPSLIELTLRGDFYTGTDYVYIEYTPDTVELEGTGGYVRSFDYELVPTIGVSGVTLDKGTMAMTVAGGAKTLTATVLPAKATNKNVTWSSSNETVATVADGVVTPIATGTTNITVTTEQGGRTATCIVSVYLTGDEALLANADAAVTALEAALDPEELIYEPYIVEAEALLAEAQAAVTAAAGVAGIDAIAARLAAAEAIVTAARADYEERLADMLLLMDANDRVWELELAVALDLAMEYYILEAEALVAPAQDAVAAAAGVEGIDEVTARLSAAIATLTAARTAYDDKADLEAAKAIIQGLALAWDTDLATTISAANATIGTADLPEGVTAIAAEGTDENAGKVVITIISGAETDATIIIAP